MAAFTSWFDSAGAQHQGHIVTTAGVAATVEQWLEFDVRWLDVLAKYGVRSFHMADIAHWKGDLAPWPLIDDKKDEGRRRAMLEELVEVAAKTQPVVFVRSVHLADYRDADSRYQLTETIGGPYAITQTTCIRNMFEVLSSRLDPVSTFFRVLIEQGDAGQHAFRQFYRKAFGRSPGIDPGIDFIEKKGPEGEDFTPLALADLIAYEHCVANTKRAKSDRPLNREDQRMLFRLLKDRLSIDSRIILGGFLENLCKRGEVPLRTTA